MFDLVAVIEHNGPSCTQGHYVCYILKQQKDDSLVGYTSDDNKI